MPRAKTVLQSQFPYHITARSHNKDQFHIPLEDVWGIMCRELYFLHIVYNVKIHSFVLMSNHFHLLATTPEANIDKALWHFMSATSRQINDRAGDTNQVYGSRYFKCIIGSFHYFMHAYKYIYRNPVEAGLSHFCEAYPYCTLHGLLGQGRLLIPLEVDTVLFPEVDETLDWLNKKPLPDQWEDVGAAMLRPTFSFRRRDHYNGNLLNAERL